MSVGATARRWRLEDDEGADLGHFDAALLTPPAPQTADLLGQSRCTRRLRELRRKSPPSLSTVIAGESE